MTGLGRALLWGASLGALILVVRPSKASTVNTGLPVPMPIGPNVTPVPARVLTVHPEAQAIPVSQTALPYAHQGAVPQAAGGSVLNYYGMPSEAYPAGSSFEDEMQSERDALLNVSTSPSSASKPAIPAAQGSVTEFLAPGLESDMQTERDASLFSGEDDCVGCTVEERALVGAVKRRRRKRKAKAIVKKVVTGPNLVKHIRQETVQSPDDSDPFYEVPEPLPEPQFDETEDAGLDAED